MILTIRTDKPESELGLYQSGKQLSYLKWHAHRQLAETIHKKLEELLSENSLSLKNLSGVVIYEGPGSYTGLRIGFSVANSLAYGLEVPVAAAGGEDWIMSGLNLLAKNKGKEFAAPKYGGSANTTKPKK